jgi:hypothetical protein
MRPPWHTITCTHLQVECLLWVSLVFLRRHLQRSRQLNDPLIVKKRGKMYVNKLWIDALKEAND